MSNTVIILTARVGSDRLPGKVVADVAGKPLAYWIIERLKQTGADICIGTTAQPEDNALEQVAKLCRVPIWRDTGNPDDVVGRMDRIIKEWYPRAAYVMRALGDCPFIEPAIIKRAVEVLSMYPKADCFAYAIPPDVWPVYGAREFPYARSGWDKMAAGARTAEEREHVDLWLNHNRERFNFVYHDPPKPDYFRPRLRLEVDYPIDLDMVRLIADRVGMLAPLKDVIYFLDDNPDIAGMNKHIVEATGLIVSYHRGLLNDWFRLMQAKPVVSWDNTVWQPPDKSKSRQVFCVGKSCFLGWAHRGTFYGRDGTSVREGRINCFCGAGRIWERGM